MEWLIIIIIGVVIYLVARKKSSKARYADDSGDTLADFRITVSTTSDYFEEPETKNKDPGKWIPPGRSVNIGNFEILNGLFYSGGRLTELSGYGTEASLVDHTLKIDSKSPDYNGDHMGYWPSFGHISPQSRAAYLEWLASDRDDPDCNIGYVFLYFYGIERRLLLDGQNISELERKILAEELLRLRNIYGVNRSFNGYVTGLLAHVWALYDNENEPDTTLLAAKREFTSVFKLLLGKAVAEEQPISSNLALAWVKSHPEYNLRTPARRCEYEFDLLFDIRYREKFGDGLTIKPNKSKLHLEYRPASASLRGYQGVKLDLPDVSRLRTPVTKLMKLAESCTDELEAYSRFVGKPENSKDSLLAVAFLPNELATLIRHDQFCQLQNWIRTKVTNGIGIIPTEEFLSQLGDDAPLKINKKEAELFANLVEKMDFGLVPDLRYHRAKPEIDGFIVFFENGHGPDFSPSHAFNQIGTILQLGAMIAAIDNHIDEAETTFLEKLISDDSQLSDTEKRSLRAYLHWRLNTKMDTNGLKARLDAISTREKAAVSHILVSVALADGKIEPNEIRQLEKLYSSLGLDKAMVSRDVHNLASTKGKASPTGEIGSVNTNNALETTFSLNRELLKMHKEETDGVRAVLESIFVDEIIADEPEEVVDIAMTTKQATSLDANHFRLYEKLIGKEQWSSEEVRAICEELNLMVDGAIEVINDWSFDSVNAPLIEDGSNVYIDLEVAKEIQAL